jgi:hypothetical protein
MVRVITPLNGGLLEVIYVDMSSRDWHCYLQVTVKVEDLQLPLTHLGLLGCSAVAN